MKTRITTITGIPLVITTTIYLTIICDGSIRTIDFILTLAIGLLIVTLFTRIVDIIKKQDESSDKS